MLALERHIGTLLKDGKHICFPVFTAQTEQHTCLLPGHHEDLQCLVRGVDAKTKWPILRTNASPQGFITIEHDHLVRIALGGVDLAGNSEYPAR